MSHSSPAVKNKEVKMGLLVNTVKIKSTQIRLSLIVQREQRFELTQKKKSPAKSFRVLRCEFKV